MGSSCCKHEPHDNHKFKTYKERHCTDVLFLLGFICYWIFCVLVLTGATENADPWTLVRGVDHMGRTCGRSPGVENSEYLAWPDFNTYDVTICVDSCALTLTDTRMTTNYLSEKFLYYCIPDSYTGPSGSISIQLSGDFESYAEEAARAIGDIWTSWLVIMLSPLIALVFAVLYILASKFLAGCMILLVMLMILVSGGLGGFMLLDYGYEAQDDPTSDNTGDRATAMIAMGWTLVALTVIFFFICVCLRKQIQLAIKIIELTSEAIMDMKCLIFFPITSLVAAILYFAYWCSACLYIFSVTTEELTPLSAPFTNVGSTWLQNTAPYHLYFKDLVWDDSLQNIFVLHLFHLLWNMQFIIYFCYLVIAGAIANWYFANVDASGEKIRGDGVGQLATSPVLRSCCRAARFNSGSVAFGSLVIAIIQMMRIIVKYIEEKLGKENQNSFQRCMFRMLHCCLWCLECCLDKISKNAYIYMAVTGDHFLSSACQAFGLVLQNFSKTVALTVLGTFVLFVGKVIVALMTVAICGFIIEGGYGDEISSVAVPCFVIFMLAYIVASLFMNVFHVSINCMFMCYLIDPSMESAGLKKAFDDDQFKDFNQSKTNQYKVNRMVERHRKNHNVSNNTDAKQDTA